MPQTTIDFLDIDDRYDNESSQIISISSGYRQLQDPDTIVIKDTTIKIVFDYPLKQAFVFEFIAADSQGFTRKKLIDTIIKTYYEIYDEEKRTTNVKVDSMEERMAKSFLINRNKTNGTYGIWGHDIDDLVIERLIYDTDSKTLRMFIGS